MSIAIDRESHFANMYFDMTRNILIVITKMQTITIFTTISITNVSF